MKRISWRSIWQRLLQRPAWARVPTGTPIRRDANMLYLFMCSAGAASGVILTNPLPGLLPQLAGSGEAMLLIGSTGLFTGWLTAHWLEERYTTAANAWPWLALSALQLVLAPLVLLAGILLIGGVLGVIAAVLSVIFLFVFLIFLILGSFGG